MNHNTVDAYLGTAVECQLPADTVILSTSQACYEFALGGWPAEQRPFWDQVEAWLKLYSPTEYNHADLAPRLRFTQAQDWVAREVYYYDGFGGTK